LNMYEETGVSFLLDRDDTLQVRVWKAICNVSSYMEHIVCSVNEA
jgi:hypothetical protein